MLTPDETPDIDDEEVTESQEVAISQRKLNRAARATWILSTLVALLLILYALVPHNEAGISTHVLVIFVVGVLFFTAVLIYLVVRSDYADIPENNWLRLVATLIALIASLIFFALTYDQIAYSDPTQFVGIQTFVDSLYFTLATTLTVGYGDIHAAGQLARIMVIIQMIFTVIVLAASARSIGGIIQNHAKMKKLEKAEARIKAKKQAAKKAAREAAEQTTKDVDKAKGIDKDSNG